MSRLCRSISLLHHTQFPCFRFNSFVGRPVHIQKHTITMSTQLLLRSEDKPHEHRSALTPYTAEQLIKAGYTVEVERCEQRIFDDAEFEAVGAQIVAKNAWLDPANKDKIIVGLKELPETPASLPNTHIQFAHVFKNQFGWQETLARYARGNGTLLDLEFLTDAQGRRVAAFGFYAGFAGAALAIKAWCLQKSGAKLGNINEYTGGKGYYANENELIEQLKADVEAVGETPSVFVMGALGRCGSGAVDLCRKVGLPESAIVKWDINETRNNPGPYKVIADQDIFINCIYLQAKIPPFIDLPTLNAPDRKLTVICDVSADNTNPNNPVPVYTETSTFVEPVLDVAGIDSGSAPISVISIDHLPSLLPRESSESFSRLLLEHMLELKDWPANEVWSRANELYKAKVAELPESVVKGE